MLNAFVNIPVSLIFAFSFIGCALFSSSTLNASDEPAYLNPDLPVDERVDDLMERMTLEEKIGQMMQIDISQINTDGAHAVELDPEKAREAMANYHIGSFLNGFADTPQRWHDFSMELQEIVFEESRLDIPVIYGIDHMHGASYLLESTIFPHNMNLANSFNKDMARTMGEITVRESAHLGHHWNFAPVQDIGREPRWARFYETFGEDPYVASELGRAYTAGLEEESSVEPYRMAATAKHFIGYSTPYSGWDRSPVDISDQTLQEIHRPPFQAVIDEGIKTVMLNSGELNGVPVHASKPIIQDLLRDEMGFEGVVLTDWADIIKLSTLDEVGYQQEHYHHAAKDEKEATYLAIKAGVDVSMTPQSFDFFYYMKELVEEGRISEERIDESVERVLRLKFELGLFENPYPTTEYFDLVGHEDHKEKALQSARESLVLLENENDLLPLHHNDVDDILVVGPRADSKRDLSGGWTLEWQGGPEEMYPDDIHTIYSGIRDEFSDAQVSLVDSIGPVGSDNYDEFINSAENADVIIMALGEEPYTEFIGDITDMNLDAYQNHVSEAVASVEVPAVMVYVGGRPRLLPDAAIDSDAVLFAGLPGYKGGEAIADIISGNYNPSGRLSFTYPSENSHFTTYDHKPTNRVSAQWEFGHGLSYTDFEYSDLELSNDTVGKDEYLTASVTLENTGDVSGKKNVLWFMRNEVGLITRPVRELKHFENVYLEPGEQVTAEFSITPEDHLFYPDHTGSDVIESGYYTLKIGNQTERFYFEGE